MVLAKWHDQLFGNSDKIIARRAKTMAEHDYFLNIRLLSRLDNSGFEGTDLLNGVRPFELLV